MRRREYLITIGATGSLGIAGCSGGTESGDSGGQEPEGESASTAEAGGGSTPESTEEPRTESESNYQVRISYEGEWSGTVGGEGSMRSVDGSGTKTFDVQGDPTIVSANAQKRDSGSGELTVEILQDGEVIARRSTTAEYGVAQVTSEDGIDGSDSSDGGDGESEASFSVRVQYSGEWQGSIAEDGSSRSVQGTGTKTIEIEGSPDTISANAQKQDDSSDELVIQILKDGEVVEETSTTAEYGVAQVSYSDF